MTYSVYELTSDDNITDEDGNILTGLYAIDETEKLIVLLLTEMAMLLIMKSELQK